MKLQAVLGMVDKIKPGNPYDAATKIQWLNELEGDIQSRLLKTAPQEIIQYTEADLEVELLVPVPYDKVYWMWVAAMIDFANGEYQKYQNTLQMVNDAYDKYAKWFHRHFHEDTGGFLYIGGTTKYGLSAYEIALNHGFEGSEEDWLESLRGYQGIDGPPGAGLNIKDQVATEEELPVEGLDPGDGYLVGEGEDALLYVWNGSEWFYKQHLGTVGPQGEDGFSPTISVSTIDGGHRITITDANGTKTVDVKDGNPGTPGAPGTSGQDGRGISKVERTAGTGAAGSSDTYTITYTDNTTSKFTVYNGADGYSPAVAVDPIAGGNRITITDAAGAKSVDILNGSDGSPGAAGVPGVSPTISVSAIEGGNRITITDANGTKSVDILDGGDGSPGTAGKDGVSPTISISAIEGGNRIAITDANGTKTVDIMDGSDGSPGTAGKDGRGISKVERTAGTGAAGSSDTYTITYTDNTTSKFTVYNGADGTSFVVKDRYETLSALKAAHPTGSEGEAYAVGTESENVIYIWGVDTGDWVPIGSLQGPQGIPGEDAREAELQVANGYVQWRLVGDTAWKNLVALSEITGPAGGDGSPGAAGKDGTSVTVKSVSESAADGGTNTVTFSDGKTLNVKNGSRGSDGSPGAAGKDGTSVTVSSVTESTEDGGTNVVNFSDGKTLNVKNGSKGADGAPGATGAGVKSMTYDSAANKWTVTLTDNTTISVDGPAIPDVSAYMPKAGGTFTGAVQAATASTSAYYVRNIKFSTTAETPTTEGDICFKLA